VRLFPVDTRKKKQLEKKKQIRELECRRDQMVDAGFLNRAKATESQISQLKRELSNL
jgi:hypothetical protein